MRTVLVVTPDDELRERLGRILSGFTVFEAAGDADALQTLRLIEVDLVLRDGRAPAGVIPAFLGRVRNFAPLALMVTVGATREEDEAAADFSLSEELSAREVDSVLRQARERQRLAQELAALRAPASAPEVERGPRWDEATFARVLRGFTRLFAAGFDLPRVLDKFVDAVAELVRPARIAVLLPDHTGAFAVAAERGLAPQIVQSVRLSPADGLARWLATQGRPARLGELPDVAVARELRLLQGVVAVPLLARGELVAVLILGAPVLGPAYAGAELETLFELATHLATVIRDVGLHHALAHEKEFTDRILFHMSSGVVTIGRDERIGTLNRRAEEILALGAGMLAGQDLRALPSPLGDMLYEALATGRGVTRSEIQLPLRRLWLEVSTYVVRDGDGTPMGAVLVFEDLTAQKELAAQKRQAEQFQLLGRVVARIADEIKNPLVSVNTFVELIGERYDDPDFRKQFGAVVYRDVRRLVEVFEKLVSLVTGGRLNFSTVDAHEVVSQLVETVDPSDDGIGKHLQLDVAPAAEPLLVRVDAGQLRRALQYLVRFLGHNTPGDAARVSLSVGRHEDGGVSEVRILVGSRTASVSLDKLERLFDPVHMVQEGLIDVGPAVSQRLVEALGGRLAMRQGKHELAFLVSLPAATP
jgi:nitrogen-specific signal transduction histidine kinase